jgi:hypothetical protein
MGLFYALIFTFAVLFVLIYGFFHLSCYVKRRYKDAENWLYRILTSFMCESFREACEKPGKMVIRAIFFAAVLAAVLVVIMHFMK